MKNKNPKEAYEVEKKKERSPLPKNWKGKGYLQQAFVLSELLKRVI